LENKKNWGFGEGKREIIQPAGVKCEEDNYKDKPIMLVDLNKYTMIELLGLMRRKNPPS
jgi:hypothetical protein